ncbi:NifU family protein [Oscillatoria sp. FACHB-1407]|uniref:NifU family protein n=1 Tax=Oscillatoria sp. FACHB-1407 TaxID=2692847 RepID=UPI001684E3C8|nr:NifU family protein [Oscillatoria sp. FACHB-1407]MBD2465210.1 NifU family protein [Oscillatoria sp. FACHB-1407]
MVQAPASQSIHQHTYQNTNQNTENTITEPQLEALVNDIHHYETIISAWDESQQATISGYKRAIEALHREAFVRLIRSVKQESMSALRHAVEDEVVYGLLRYHNLIKPPAPPLEQRIELALAEVRPGLKGHNGDVELVAIHPPDTVEVRLIGACSHCPASSLTLTQGVEEVIKRYCPEINRVIATETTQLSAHTASQISPFVSHHPGWLEVTALAEVPQGRVLAMKLEGKSLLLTRIGSEVVCYHNACSHLGVPLDGGEIEQQILTCPDHGFQYRLATGECLTSPQTPLQSYPVEVRDGQVFVQLGL